MAATHLSAIDTNNKKQKKRQTRWYEMLTAPPLADVQRAEAWNCLLQTSRTKKTNSNHNDGDEPSPLEPRRLHGVPTRNNKVTPTPSTAANSEAGEEEEEQEEEEEEQEEQKEGDQEDGW